MMLVFLVSCFLIPGRGRPTIEGVDEGDEVVDTAETACELSDYQSVITAICRKQHPPDPAPGENGSSCTDDDQCDSQLCLEPFGSAAYCTIGCPDGDECPVGFACQDAGNGFSACYQSVCIYAGSDQSDCVDALANEVDESCRFEDCAAELEAWLTCLDDGPRLCGVSDADDECGIERGFLEECCPGCSSQRF